MNNDWKNWSNKNIPNQQMKMIKQMRIMEVIMNMMTMINNTKGMFKSKVFVTVKFTEMIVSLNNKTRINSQVVLFQF